MDVSLKCYKCLMGWVVRLQGSKAVHRGHQKKGGVFNENGISGKSTENKSSSYRRAISYLRTCTNVYTQAFQMEYYLVPNGHLRLGRNLHLCRYHIYSNNCTIIRYNNILTCGNPATRFGQFQGGIQQKCTMATYVVAVQLAVKDINVLIFVMELSWKCSSWFPLHSCRATKIFCLAV